MKPSRRNRRLLPPNPLSPEEQKEKEERTAAIWAQFQADMVARQKEQDRVESVLKFLEIPIQGTAKDSVNAQALVDILMDDEKAKAIFAKLRNKAFW